MKVACLEAAGDATAGYVVAGSTVATWEREVAGTALFETGQMRFAEAICDPANYWDDLLQGGRARPVAVPETLDIDLVGTVQFTLKGAQWEIRASRVKATGEWVECTDGVPKLPGGRNQRSVPIEFPPKIAAAWLERNVPSFDLDQVDALREETARRGWTYGEFLDLVEPYLAEDIEPPSTADDFSAVATPFEVPQRITVAWLERVAPTLSDGEIATLIGAMRERGWSDGEIEDFVFAYRDDDLSDTDVRSQRDP